MLQHIETADDIHSSMPDPVPLADEAVVARVLAGDVASFELIMRRYNQRLFRIARSIVGDDGEAEDVLQEAYLRAYEHLAQFAGRAKFSTWLTRIVVHEASARRRRRQRLPLIPLQDAEIPPMASRSEPDRIQDELRRTELAALVRQVVDQLPSDLRVVFTARLVEGLDTAETAECLGLTAANVKVRLHRARSQVRKTLERRIGAEVRQLYSFDGPRCDRIVRGVLGRLARR